MGRDAFEELVRLVGLLRADEGCPWDRLQDHRSLRPYLLEEAHEVISAIDAEDPDALADELGDLLLQVLLHSQIAAEAGHFSIETVVDRLRHKLIRRHPHVFGRAPRDLDAIRQNWKTIKEREGKTRYPLPLLLEARKLVSELEDERAIQATSYPSKEAEEGARLLSTIAAVWRGGTDPEIALAKAMAHLSALTRRKR